MRSVLIGALLGLVLSCGAVGVVTWSVTASQLSKVKRGWNLKPILVAQRDIPDGKPLTYDDLSQRNLPEQFVTASFIAPSDASALLGKPLSLAVVAGDPITWADFVELPSHDRISACVNQALPGARAAADQARDQALHDFASQLPPLGDAPEPIPPLVFDAKDEAAVVVATRKIEENQPIPAAALKVEKLPRQLVTAAVVPASALEKVTGALALVSLEPGDPLRWQYLDNARQPMTPLGCLAKVEEAREKAGKAAARAAVEAFLPTPAEGSK